MGIDVVVSVPLTLVMFDESASFRDPFIMVLAVAESGAMLLLMMVAISLIADVVSLIACNHSEFVLQFSFCY